MTDTTTIQNLILKNIKNANPKIKADEIAFQPVHMQIEIGKSGVKVDDYETAVNALIDAGLLTYEGSSPYIKITAEGIKRL